MKRIETKINNKLIIRFVPDDYKEDGCDDKHYGDLTTSRRARMTYDDIPDEKWNKVFKKGENNGKKD